MMQPPQLAAQRCALIAPHQYVVDGLQAWRPATARLAIAPRGDRPHARYPLLIEPNNRPKSPSERDHATMSQLQTLT